MRAARSLAHQLLLTSLPRVAPSKGHNDTTLAHGHWLLARAIVPNWWPRPQAQHPENSRAFAYAESQAAHPKRQVDAPCNAQAMGQQARTGGAGGGGGCGVLLNSCSHLALCVFFDMLLACEGDRFKLTSSTAYLVEMCMCCVNRSVHQAWRLLYGW